MSGRKLTTLLLCLACFGAGPVATAADAAPSSPPKLKVDAVEVGTATAPLVVRVSAPFADEVEITVNGRQVREPFTQIDARTQEIQLNVDDGLRVGADKLRVSAWDGGTQGVASLTVRVPAWALAADAGVSSDEVVDRPDRLGAPRAPSGRRIDHRWRIVGAPRGGGDAILTGGDDAHPVLTAEEPGAYVLQEEADPQAPGEPDSFDQITVDAVPDDSPIGVPINTIDAGGTVSIADKTYGSAAAGTNYAVLERATRDVVASGHVSNDTGGIATLSGVADKYATGARYLMVVGGGTKVPEGDLAAFAAVFKKLGATPFTEENFTALKDGQQYSAIGVPGWSPGTAMTRIPGGYLPAVSGAITGYLARKQQLVGNPVYEYVSPEQPTFDTAAAGTDARTDVMTIDGKTYKGTLPAGATAGLHVVVLESLSLRLVSDKVMVTNGTPNDRAAQAAVAKDLATDIQKPGGPVVFVETIGKPKGAGPEWDGVVGDLRRLGADALDVYALDGTTEYGLVARLGATAPPAEASTAYDRGPYPVPEDLSARLVGSLARSRTSNFVPNVYGKATAQNPTGGVNLGLLSAPYGHSQPWPELAPGAGRPEAAAAAKYLCTVALLCGERGDCSTLRECFWRDYQVKWGDAYAAITSAKPPSTSEFSTTTFEAVQKELGEETKEVAAVKSYLDDVVKPLQDKKADSYVDLQDVGTKVWESVQKPAADNSRAWGLDLVGKVISVGGFAPPPASNAARGIAALFALGAYLSTSKGQPILGSEIKAKTSELGQELLKRVELAAQTTDGMGELIVSDFGKLKYTAEHIHDTDWKIESPQKAGAQIRIAAKQWFYQALIPVAYPYLIRGSAYVYNARSINCVAGTFGWPDQPDTFQMAAIVGYDAGGNPIRAIFFFAKGIGKYASPPASLGDEMFRPVSQGGLAIEKLQFFTPRVFNGKLAHAANNVRYCLDGWMPNYRDD